MKRVLFVLLSVLILVMLVVRYESALNFGSWLSSVAQNLFHQKEMCWSSLFLLGSPDYSVSENANYFSKIGGTTNNCGFDSVVTRGQLDLVMERLFWLVMILFLVVWGALVRDWFAKPKEIYHTPVHNTYNGMTSTEVEQRISSSLKRDESRIDELKKNVDSLTKQVSQFSQTPTTTISKEEIEKIVQQTIAMENKKSFSSTWKRFSASGDVVVLAIVAMVAIVAIVGLIVALMFVF